MIDLNQIERRARAEVLATCIQAVDKEQYTRRYDSQAVWDTFEDIKKALKELQPAAQALEELLRIAGLKAVKSSPECWHYNTETDQEFMERYFSWRKNRIAELEKARAISEKP